MSSPVKREKQIRERERVEDEVVECVKKDEVDNDVVGDFRGFDVLAGRECRLGICEKYS